MRTKAGISGISLSPTLTPSMRAGPPKIWKGGVHAVKIIIHYQYKFLGVIRILCNLRRKNHSIRAFSFSGEKQKFRLSQRFWPPTGLRSHVTITLSNKSRYDLILKINETALL